jgi:hypothetical protein
MAVTTKNLFRPSGQDTLKSVERQRQMAAALQGQAMQPLRGQTAGRTYVGASGLEGAGKFAQMLAGTYLQGQADDREKQIEDDERSSFLEGIQNYNTAMKPVAGTAARAETNVIPPQGDKYSIHTSKPVYQPASGQYQAAQAEIPARERTKQEKIQEAINLMGSKNERLRRFGENRYAELLVPTKPLAVSKNERLVDPNDPTNVILEAEPEELNLPADAKMTNWLIDKINDPSVPEEEKKGFRAQLEKMQVNNTDKIINDPEGAYRIIDGTAVPVETKSGKHVGKATDNIEHMVEKAGKMQFAKDWAKMSAEAKANLPKVIDVTGTTLKTMDEVRANPLLNTLVGFSRGQFFKMFPGSPYKSLANDIRKVINTSYESAYVSLKGGGHITVFEAQTVSEAMQVIDSMTDMKGFVKAFNDYQHILELGLARAEGKAANADKFIPNWRNQQPANSGKINNQQQFDAKNKQTSEGQNNVNEPDLVESILQSEGIE